MASAPAGMPEDKTKIAPLSGSVANNAFGVNKWGIYAGCIWYVYLKLTC